MTPVVRRPPLDLLRLGSGQGRKTTSPTIELAEANTRMPWLTSVMTRAWTTRSGSSMESSTWIDFLVFFFFFSFFPLLPFLILCLLLFHDSLPASSSRPCLIHDSSLCFSVLLMGVYHGRRGRVRQGSDEVSTAIGAGTNRKGNSSEWTAKARGNQPKALGNDMQLMDMVGQKNRRETRRDKSRCAESSSLRRGTY